MQREKLTTTEESEPVINRVDAWKVPFLKARYYISNKSPSKFRHHLLRRSLLFRQKGSSERELRKGAKGWWQPGWGEETSSCQLFCQLCAAGEPNYIYTFDLFSLKARIDELLELDDKEATEDDAEIIAVFLFCCLVYKNWQRPSAAAMYNNIDGALCNCTFHRVAFSFYKQCSWRGVIWQKAIQVCISRSNSSVRFKEQLKSEFRGTTQVQTCQLSHIVHVRHTFAVHLTLTRYHLTC